MKATVQVNRLPNCLVRNRLEQFSPLFDRTDDPLGFEAGDANLYRYVGNSPTDATDPSGLVPFPGIINPDSPYLGW